MSGALNGSSSAESPFFGPDDAGNRVGNGVSKDKALASWLAGIFGKRVGRDFSWQTRGFPPLCQRHLQTRRQGRPWSILVAGARSVPTAPGKTAVSCGAVRRPGR